MDYNTCNHKQLNQFQAEARRWATNDKSSTSGPTKRGQRQQPAKRKKKAKK